MASFPVSVKAFTTKNDGPGNTILAAHINDLQSEVTAVETNLLGGSTNQVYIGSSPAGFSSEASLHRLNSSQLSISGASTLGTVQAGASTVTTLSAGASTLATLQVGNSTITGNLTVSGTITNAGIPALLLGSTFATASTSIVDLSTVTITGLTQLDTVEVFYSVQASTVAINNFRLRNKTDGVTVVDLNDQSGLGDFTAGRRGMGAVVMRQSVFGSTAVEVMNSMQTSANTRINTGQGASYTTAWTGSVEYAIQGACSTTLGNLRGSWGVYVRKGQ